MDEGRGRKQGGFKRVSAVRTSSDLSAALQRGDTAWLAELLQHGGPALACERLPGGQAPLHAAVSALAAPVERSPAAAVGARGDAISAWEVKEAVEMLLAHKADPNTKGPPLDETPLQVSIRRSGADAVSLQVVEALLVGRADPNHLDNLGEGPLMEASCAGNLGACQLLLGYRASLEARNIKGQRPVDLAEGAAKAFLQLMCQAGHKHTGRKARESPGDGNLSSAAAQRGGSADGSPAGYPAPATSYASLGGASKSPSRATADLRALAATRHGVATRPGLPNAQAADGLSGQGDSPGSTDTMSPPPPPLRPRGFSFKGAIRGGLAADDTEDSRPRPTPTVQRKELHETSQTAAPRDLTDVLAGRPTRRSSGGNGPEQDSEEGGSKIAAEQMVGESGAQHALPRNLTQVLGGRQVRWQAARATEPSLDGLPLPGGPADKTPRAQEARTAEPASKYGFDMAELGRLVGSAEGSPPLLQRRDAPGNDVMMERSDSAAPQPLEQAAMKPLRSLDVRSGRHTDGAAPVDGGSESVRDTVGVGEPGFKPPPLCRRRALGPDKDDARTIVQDVPTPSSSSSAPRFGMLAVAADQPASELTTLREKGDIHLKTKRYADAKRCYSAALQLDPGNASLLASRARTCLMMGDWAEALEDASYAAKREPTNSRASEQYARALLLLDQHEDGIDWCSRRWRQLPCEQADARDFDRAAFASIMQRLADERRAICDIEGTLRTRLKPFQEVDSATMLLQRLGDLLKELHSAEAKSPWGRRLRLARVQALLLPKPGLAGVPAEKTRRWQADALSEAQSLVAENGACGRAADIRYWLARCVLCGGRREDAREMLKEALRMKDGQFDAAEDLLDSLRTLEEKREQGKAAWDRKDWAAAKELYDAAVQADTDRLDADFSSAMLCNRAAAKHKLGQKDAALDDVSQALLIVPGYVKALFRRGMLYTELEMYADAIADFDQVARQEPSFVGLADWRSRARRWAMQRPEQNHYSVLGVGFEAGQTELKRAYKAAALRWHPDKNLDNSEVAAKMFKDVQRAFQGVLSLMPECLQ
eukprot:TRINITY_DN37816_c2_g1_i5.p1 TRINITY_DN37816_c2_g1~~TRINITY_DN37816_c2_g1_i5.p1  ORF type:complete len:1052 (-),score=223.08 TRINITY_DN37816_c2_g1_i5:169-3324(-)